MADIKFDNPNFNKEKYGKYFDDEGKIKDMRGWLDARNNDLKSASDPADLVNKINNQNQYGNEKYDKFFRNYGNFLFLTSYLLLIFLLLHSVCNFV